ncbi:MalY/PatB family protein [Enterococcus sp.]|uniref:MalY/PatB family protein n=2 Tax=Enterococcus sp. TaxID=35783 RepID=UPI002898979C|nr:MalY/PatB family protein [Enterococcus sp.]
MFFDEEIDRRGTHCTQWDYIEDRFGQKDLLPFTISDTDFKVPSVVEKALIKRMQHPVYGYTRWNHTDFKQSVYLWYQKRFATSISEDWLVYSPSVIYSIKQLIDILTVAGDGVIIQTPAYDAFFHLIISNDRLLVDNPLLYQDGNYQINLTELARLMAQPNNKVLLLCSPHNPTGRVWKKEELSAILQLADQHGVFVISDEIHMDILRQGQVHVPLIQLADQNIAVVTSGSKTFNFPGLIYSYGLIPNQNIRDKFIKQMKEANGLSSTSIFGLTATIAAYQEGDTWVDALNLYLDQNISFVKNYLQKYHSDIKIVNSQATYLMWLDCSKLRFSMPEIQDRLINQGKIAIMDGAVYGESGKQFLRLNIGCPRSKLEEGMTRLTKSLQ